MDGYTGDPSNQAKFEQVVQSLNDFYMDKIPNICTQNSAGVYKKLHPAFPWLSAREHEVTYTVTQDDALLVTDVQRALEDSRWLSEQMESVDKSLDNRVDTACTAVQLLEALRPHINRRQETAEGFRKAAEALEALRAKVGSVQLPMLIICYDIADDPGKAAKKAEIVRLFQEYTTRRDTFHGFYREFVTASTLLANEEGTSRQCFLSHLVFDRHQKVAGQPVEAAIVAQDELWTRAINKISGLNDPVQPNQAPPVAANVQAPQGLGRDSATAQATWMCQRTLLETQIQRVEDSMESFTEECIRDTKRSLIAKHSELQNGFSALPADLRPGIETIPDIQGILGQLNSKLESLRSARVRLEEEQRLERTEAIRTMPTIQMPVLTGQASFLSWKQGQIKLNTHTNGYKRAQALKSTVQDPTAKARIATLNDFDDMYEAICDLYASESQLVPALLRDLQDMEKAKNLADFRRVSGRIRNAVININSMGEAAMSYITVTVLESWVLKLPDELQMKWEEHLMTLDLTQSQAGEGFSETGSDHGPVSVLHDLTPLNVKVEDKNLRIQFIKFLKQQEKIVNNVVNRQRLGGETPSFGVTPKQAPKPKPPPPPKPGRGKDGYKVSSYSASADGTPCVVCEDVAPHRDKGGRPSKSLVACRKFREMTNKERRGIIARVKYCERCLSPGCSPSKCRIKDKCGFKCGKNHHYFLCSDKEYKPKQVAVESNCGNTATGVRLMLGKSKVQVGKNTREATVFYDLGSTASFCLQSFAKRHGLRGQPVTINVARLDSSHEKLLTKEYNITLKSNEGLLFTIPCYEINRLTSVNKMSRQVVKKLSREFKVPPGQINNAEGEADLLIGANALNLHPKLLRVNRDGVGIYHSMFGLPYYVCGGGSEGALNKSHSVNFVDTTKREFFSSWLTQDQIGLNTEPKCSVCLSAPKCKRCAKMQTPQTWEEQQQDKIISSHVNCDFEKKQVTATLPWKTDPREAFHPRNSNRGVVEKMATSLFKSLKRDGKLYEYTAAFMDAVERGVYREASEEEIQAWDAAENPSNFVSHQAVLSEKPNASTPVRVVVNSSVAHGPTSLNDMLCKGSPSISNILHVLLRLREHPILVIGDLKSAYNSIDMSTGVEGHCRRLLWVRKEDLDKQSGSDPPRFRTFLAQTACFGDRPSGQMLEISKLAIAKWCVEQGPSWAGTEAAILYASYVDDVLKSTRTVEEAEDLKERIPKAFSMLGFRFKPFQIVARGLEVDPDLMEKDSTMLGYRYNYVNDTLEVRHRINLSVKRRSARVLPDLVEDVELEDLDLTLNDLASIQMSQFDPLGLESPFLAKGKILFSRIKKSGVQWKEKLSETHQQEVKQYAREILSLVRDPIQFPRSVTEEGFNLTKLFVFADASSCSLAVVLYGLFTNQEGEKKTALLNAKHAMVSRTIPQNELWALVAANRLLHNYINACDTEFLEQAAILSDSKCCLEMIKPTYLAKDVYTKNKTNEIHHLNGRIPVELKYFHIPSEMNRPADYGTRGEVTLEYIRSKEWKCGPEFIQSLDELPEATLHLTIPPNTGSDYPEVVDVDVSAAAVEPDQAAAPQSPLTKLMERTSILSRCVRSMCLVKRFINLIKTGTFKQRRAQGIKRVPNWESFPPFGFNTEEISDAFTTLVWAAQQASPVEKLSTKQLLPFTDPTSSVIYTRQRYSQEAMINVFGKTALPILDANCRLATLILRNAHICEVANEGNRAHVGLHQTIVNSRCGDFGTYIPRVKQKVKGLIWNCVPCRKLHRAQQTAQIGDRKALGLPRPPDGSAFNNIVIDFIGPIKTKMRNQKLTKTTKTFKTWGCVIYCQDTHAINIIGVEGYDKQSFYTAFKTHCAQHGIPSHIQSDPMASFASFAKECNEDINVDDYTSLFSGMNIAWKLIPPGSQHRNGSVESIVKRIKLMTHFLTIHESSPILSPMEIQLLFANIGELLNRRPIASRIDGDSITILSPNSLLLGRSSRGNIGCGGGDSDIFARAKLVTDLTSQFWNTLQRALAESPFLCKANKWRTQTRCPRVGDIVLVLYAGKVSEGYRIGRVIEIIDSRTITVMVSPPQSGVNLEHFLPTKTMTVAIQRTVLLCEGEEGGSSVVEGCSPVNDCDGSKMPGTVSK